MIDPQGPHAAALAAVDASVGTEPDAEPAPPAAEVAGPDTDPSGPATITRADAIERIAAQMVDEGTPPFTARVLASIYMTSSELDAMLAALDSAGGLPGISTLIGGMFRKRRKGTDDE